MSSPSKTVVITRSHCVRFPLDLSASFPGQPPHQTALGLVDDGTIGTNAEVVVDDRAVRRRPSLPTVDLVRESDFAPLGTLSPALSDQRIAVPSCRAHVQNWFPRSL